MTKISKLILFAAIVAALIVTGCAKPPVEELDNAKAAAKAAQEQGAEKCATEEYTKAQAAIASAEAKMAEAENGGSKSELYKQAKDELLQALADLEKAKEVAAERSKINDKAQAELDATKQKLDAAAGSEGRYSESYRAAMDKINKAQALIDKCEGEKALALLKEVEYKEEAIKEEIVEGKAEEKRAEAQARMEEIKASAEDYTVVKGDNLWNISKAKYMNPFMWPLIYWANQEQIKDPDLIFPGQVFKISQMFNDSEKAKADQFAKTRGPWSLFDNK